MRKSLLISFLFAALHHLTSAQVFSIPAQKFSYPDLWIRAGFSGAFTVRMDVDSLVPHNIQVVRFTTDCVADSTFPNLFLKSIAENLQLFSFTQDTIGYELTLNYILVSDEKLNTDYAERVSATEVRIVARRRQPQALWFK